MGTQLWLPYYRIGKVEGPVFWGNHWVMLRICQ